MIVMKIIFIILAILFIISLSIARSKKCNHDFEFTRKPVTSKEWVLGDGNSMVDMEYNGHWEYHNRTEVRWRCKKCGYNSWDLE